MLLLVLLLLCLDKEGVVDQSSATTLNVCVSASKCLKLYSAQSLHVIMGCDSTAGVAAAAVRRIRNRVGTAVRDNWLSFFEF